MADNIIQQTGMAINPNFDPAEYARQQQAMQLGQALLAQGLQAPEGSMVSGHYVAPAATQQLARLLNMYAGNKMMTGGNEYMLRTNIGNTQAMLNSLPGSNQGAMTGTPSGGAAVAAPFFPAGSPQAPASSPDAASSAAGYSPMAGAGQGGNNPFTRENVIQGMILNGFSPEAAKAFWARTAPAPTQDQLNSRDAIIGQSVQNNLATQNMTPEQKLLRAWQEAPEGSPQKAVLAGLIQKAQTQVVSGGQSLYGFGGNGPALAAVAPTNSTQYAVGGNGSVLASGIPGAPQTAAAYEGATNAAKVGTNLYSLPDQTGAPRYVTGNEAAGKVSIYDAMRQAESGGNPNAVSPAGARGQMQLMPGTARGLGVNPNDPVQNVAGGVAYFDQLKQKYGGNDAVALAAYNWGPGNVDKWLKSGGDPAKLPQETRNYVDRVLGMTGKPAVTSQSQTGKELVTQGVGMYQGAVKEAQNNPQFHQALDEMWQLANSGKFGPGTGAIAKFKAMLSNSGIDMSGAQTDQDVMKKMASFISSSQLGAGGGTGTDTQLNNILSGLPHGDMTNEAMKKVIPLLKSQLDVKQGRASVAANYAQQNPNDLSGLPHVMSQYNSLADPGTVSIGQSFAAASKQGPQAVRALESKMMQQYGNRWAGIKQNVMKLDSMGAFQ